jgi:hypothetical protein
MSTIPTIGMSRHAHASGMPKIAKYGSPGGLGDDAEGRVADEAGGHGHA